MLPETWTPACQAGLGHIFLHEWSWAYIIVAGPSGASVREISRQTGADIKSWTEKPDHKSQSSRPTRSFVIEVLLVHGMRCSAVSMSASSATSPQPSAALLAASALSPPATLSLILHFRRQYFPTLLQSSLHLRLSHPSYRLTVTVVPTFALSCPAVCVPGQGMLPSFTP